MWKMFSMNSNYVWIDKVKDLVHFYNNRLHRTIKMKPVDVKREHEQFLLRSAFNYSQEPVKRTKYKVNDFVRVSKYKGVFEKGYTPNWGTEIFKIVKVNKQYPEFYYLEDYTGEPIKGGFYAHELQKVKHPDGYLIEKVLKRKGKKAFCKFLGFSNEHNSWVDADTIA